MIITLISSKLIITIRDLFHFQVIEDKIINKEEIIILSCRLINLVCKTSDAIA